VSTKIKSQNKDNGISSKSDKATSAKKATTKKAKSRKVKKDVGEATKRCEGILCPAAMDNLYYIAHDAADALRLRGFRWKTGSKGKKAARHRSA